MTTLIVEVDSYRSHRTQAAFAADRERDQALSMAGCRVVRFPALQLQRDPAGAAERLRRLIAVSRG